MGVMNRIFLSGHPIFQISIIPSAIGKIAEGECLLCLVLLKKGDSFKLEQNQPL